MFKNAAFLLIVCLGGWIQVSAQELPAQPPPYCNPCIFYSGDFDPNPQARPNGLLNGLFAGNVDGEVWVPFTVGNRIKISGLFINELFPSPPPPTAPTKWSIRAGVSEGDGGTEQCHGEGVATATPTGRTFVFKETTYTEWTYLLKLPSSQFCVLENAGSNLPFAGDLPPQKGQCPPDCFVSVEPDTATGTEPAVSSGFLSDVPASGAQHHFGLPNVNDSSFFSSTSFGFNFVDARTACQNGPPLAITKVGCRMFSVGLLGRGQ